MVYLSTEPTNTLVGKYIREVLRNKIDTDPKVLQMLFATDRLEHVVGEHGLLHRIFNEQVVVLDRYYYSSLAYGSIDVPLNELIDMNRTSIDLLDADITFYLHVPVETAMSRLKTEDLFETKEKLTRISQNYNNLFMYQNKVVEIDGELSQDEISEKVWNVVYPILIGDMEAR